MNVRGGIYRIRSAVTNDSYIGRTVCFRTREANHKKRLDRNQHHSPYLQNAWNKYGASGFCFEPLLICSPQYALRIEQGLLDAGRGRYNVSRSAKTPVQFGDKRPRDVVEKTAAALRGTRLSPERVAKISAGLMGNQNRKGIRHTAETCAKMAAIQRGRKHSPETRAKMSATAKNRSDEYRAKMSAALRGRIISVEARRKTARALTGRKTGPMSAEHRANISVGQVARHARRRAAGV